MGILILDILFQPQWTFQEGIWKFSVKSSFLCLEIFGNAGIPCKKEYLHIHVDVHTFFPTFHYQAYIFLLFGALQSHDISFTLTFYFLIDGDAVTVMCKMIFMYLLPRKEKKQRRERTFFDKTEIRTRLLLIKDWWRGIHCLQEKTFVKTIDIGSFW